MKKLVATLSLVLTLVAACTKEKPITQGEVREKIHYPHTVTRKVDCHFNCEHESPERCVFIVREADASGHDTGRQGEVEVPCDRAWELTQVGQWWSKNGDPRPTSSATKG